MNLLYNILVVVGIVGGICGGIFIGIKYTKRRLKKEDEKLIEEGIKVMNGEKKNEIELDGHKVDVNVFKIRDLKGIEKPIKFGDVQNETK